MIYSSVDWFWFYDEIKKINLLQGAILIFLPGYDEIVGLRDRILFDDKRFADNAHR